MDALREAKERADAIERRAVDNSRDQPDGHAIQKALDEEADKQELESFFAGFIAAGLKSREMQRNDTHLTTKARLQRIQPETRIQLLDQREICRNTGLEAIGRWEQAKKVPSKTSREERGERNNDEGDDYGRVVLWLADDA